MKEKEVSVSRSGTPDQVGQLTENSPPAGSGWALDLKPDGKVIPQSRPGDFAVRQ